MENVIQIRNLRKTYGNGASATAALRHVDLDVRGGELLTLMGPSGSGKTTLLSIMGCILRATEGSVRVGGEEVVGLPEKKLPAIRLAHFGFIFQSFNLFPALTARENVEIALDLKKAGKGAARKKAVDLLAQVGIADKAEAYPEDLSGGQKQRVAIARALAGDPPIVLADEPTASLDSVSGHIVMELLTSLARERRRAVVVVTHDPRVLQHADRVVRIEDGAVAADLDKDEFGSLRH